MMTLIETAGVKIQIYHNSSQRIPVNSKVHVSKKIGLLAARRVLFSNQSTKACTSRSVALTRSIFQLADARCSASFIVCGDTAVYSATCSVPQCVLSYSLQCPAVCSVPQPALSHIVFCPTACFVPVCFVLLCIAGQLYFVGVNLIFDDFNNNGNR